MDHIGLIGVVNWQDYTLLATIYVDKVDKASAWLFKPDQRRIVTLGSDSNMWLVVGPKDGSNELVVLDSYMQASDGKVSSPSSRGDCSSIL
jgi:alanyl-tRNA synthetase